MIDWLTLLSERKMEIRTAHAIFNISSLDPDIDQAFTNLYRAWVYQHPCNLSDFQQAALEFFDRARGDTTLQDRFFSNLGPLANLYFNNEHWHKAENVWRMALEPALEWESRCPGEFIHKGTPFYFWGMAAISRGELDLGYTLMHQALEEDIRTHNTEHPQTPAFFFAILDYDNVNQAFRHWPLSLAEFLERFLASYRASRGRTLLLDEFRAQFLINPPLDVVFLFAYTLGRFFLLSRIPEYALQSGFADQLETNLLFDLILVTDVEIRAHNPGQRDFSMQAAFLSAQAGLGLNQNMLQQQVNQASQNDFEATLTDLLDGGYRFQDGTSPSPMAADLAISYVLRNYGAHNVSSVPTVRQRFLDIRQSLFNVLFLAVEVL
jgi:hypothetical protein